MSGVPPDATKRKSTLLFDDELGEQVNLVYHHHHHHHLLSQLQLIRELVTLNAQDDGDDDEESLSSSRSWFQKICLFALISLVQVDIISGIVVIGLPGRAGSISLT